MKISIAMATYNGAKYIQEQLDSFLSQTQAPDELIVCDDRSSDKTIEILEAFKKNAHFPVQIYINDKNLGHEGNFGKAIDLCTGELIFLSDQDDVWFPEKLKTVENIFQSQPKTLVVINDLEITDADLQMTGKTVLGQIREKGISGKDDKGFIIGCGTAFRRELKSIILPIPELNFGHDKWIHSIGMAIGSRFVLKQKLQLYRRHESNASSWSFNANKRITWKEMIQSSTEMDMTSQYEKNRLALNIIESRWMALGSKFYADFENLQSYSRSLSELVNAQTALTRRTKLFQSAWLQRKILAICMLFTGDYKYFLGCRSFAKDLLR